MQRRLLPRLLLACTSSSPLLHQRPCGAHLQLSRAQNRPAVPRQPGYSTASSQSSRPICPRCSTALPTPLPVCPKCYYISDAKPEMSYHEMLGVPYEPNPFIVSNLELKRRLRELQSVIHPDKWVGKNEREQQAAGRLSSVVNNALHHLSDPLRRAEYILSREGFTVEETDKIDDPMFLMEILELREQLSDAQSRREVDEIREDNSVKMEEIIKEIEDLVGEKDWPAVRAATIKLRYLYGIDKAAEAWPSSFSDH
ncbi:Co-chaperone Hsc20 [Obba rivulosa]|uniref:Co-chaperone Hsc20 n=1 Tax=Obba rivulosa TaxID=1052685 RepID=A0A8E2J6Y9_9APHY|nr:Co-chaperone Hsc20 [Obba rivulosa]